MLNWRPNEVAPSKSEALTLILTLAVSNRISHELAKNFSAIINALILRIESAFYMD